MGYDILIDSEKVGMGLSSGELNQWLLEIVQELNEEEQKAFMKDFGYSEGSKESFEDFLYRRKHQYPLILRFGKVYMVLEKAESTF